MSKLKVQETLRGHKNHFPVFHPSPDFIFNIVSTGEGTWNDSRKIQILGSRLPLADLNLLKQSCYNEPGNKLWGLVEESHSQTPPLTSSICSEEKEW